MPGPDNEAIEAQLEELVSPAVANQMAYYRQLGLRSRILNLPLMVAAVLTMVWRQVPSVHELTRMLAEAALRCAEADEPLEENFIRAHALVYAEKMGVDLATASLRVFSNAEGAYGSNVNHLVDSGSWTDEESLAEQYSRRKCFAYGRSGAPRRRDAARGRAERLPGRSRA